MSLALSYIYHDGFLLKTPQCNVVFDYWKDPDTPNPRFLDSLDSRKPLYVLVSHHHKDHFNPEIFLWSKRFENIHYILSRDTFRAARHFINPASLYTGNKRIEPDRVSDLAPGEGWNDEAINIRAYGSTDIGNSYLVRTQGKVIFHAGDLNAWVWKDESTPQEIAAATAAFNRILDTISADTTGMDIAMFPVDPRLGTDFWTGAAIFVRRFNVRLFVPMHFTLADQPDKQLDYIAAACNFSAYANPRHGEYVGLTAPGAEWCEEP